MKGRGAGINACSVGAAGLWSRCQFALGGEQVRYPVGGLRLLQACQIGIEAPA